MDILFTTNELYNLFVASITSCRELRIQLSKKLISA